MLLGLRTTVYYVANIEEAKEWYTKVLGIKPYFNEPFYVGYNIGGYELGLHPGEANKVTEKHVGAVSYWGVNNIQTALKHLLLMGASLHDDAQDVGGGIYVATVVDPFGNIFGIIENPHFSLIKEN